MAPPSFKESPDAYCLWAKSHQNRQEGLRLLAEPLRDGSWKDAPGAWITGLSWGYFWNDPACRTAALELRSELITAILSGTLDDAAYAVLPGIFNLHGSAPLREAGAIAVWLVQHAGPNDAAMVANIVDQFAYDREGTLRKDCFPLVEWLLTHGSSELRSGRRSMLVAHLVPLVVEHGDVELIAPAIRYVLYNEHRLKADAHGVNTIEKLVPAVEQVIVSTGSAALVGDLVEALDAPALEVYLDRVLRRWGQVPRSRQNVVARLAKGEIEPHDPPATWMQVVAGPPVDLSFGSESIARSAANGLLRHMIGSHAELPGVAVHRDRQGWGYIAGRGFLAATNLLTTRHAEDIRTLQNCAGHDRGVMAGVHDAVKDATEAPDLADVRAMLLSPGTDESVVFAALELLKGKPPQAPPHKTSGNIDHIIDAIQHALVADSPVVCGFAFRRAVQGATKATAENLEGERAFVLRGDTLVVSQDPLQGLLTVSDDRDVQRALGVMYAIHEVVHDFQGIAEKADVSNVRFAGAETALMHIDLGADHVAAVAASLIFPQWDLLWLKDWAGRSIPAFPAGLRHPRYSRIRKTLRLVGSRVDLAVRRLGIGTEHLLPGSYAFADFSPAGGDFIAMVNRPPFVVVKVGQIIKSDVDVLFSGIEGVNGVIEQVDEVIARAITTQPSR